MIKLTLKTAQFLLFAILLLLQTIGWAQFDIPKVPEFQTSVYDYATILNDSEKQLLEDKLIKYSDSTTTQIVFISIESLKGEDIGILTPKWAHEWGIGQADKDNGVLILLAKEERKIWISAGYGVEDRLTAGITGEIIRNIIIPEFKKGDFYLGLNKGADVIFEVLKGKYKGTRIQDKPDFDILPFIIFFIFLVVIFIILFKNNSGGPGSGTGRFNGTDFGDTIILSRMGRNSGGFGGFGSSGGGFGGGGFGGGFGGGGFSGGGAGGSW
ncbi:YgcG family protein [Flavobacterium sp.]|uniref:TPM domain-containing protein n=1 Tax=Flavobacterium sp. TaxID=239 RepID=UPI00352767BB